MWLMPRVSATQITDAEREAIGRWIKAESPQQ